MLILFLNSFVHCGIGVFVPYYYFGTRSAVGRILMRKYLFDGLDQLYTVIIIIESARAGITML
ncbi:MAG: hypothetical protein J6O50_07635 [Ruminiclostridium sp.]|nr:hypothetical protein [Ruminiclostridium sp.]